MVARTGGVSTVAFAFSSYFSGVAPSRSNSPSSLNRITLPSARSVAPLPKPFFSHFTLPVFNSTQRSTAPPTSSRPSKPYRKPSRYTGVLK